MKKTKQTIVIPMEKVMPDHLEFEVVEELPSHTFTVVDHTCGNAPTLYYTGFPDRTTAERFVLAQPEAWE